MIWLIYQKDTGEIQFTIKGPELQAQAQMTPDLKYIAVDREDFDANVEKVIAGVVVPKSTPTPIDLELVRRRAISLIRGSISSSRAQYITVLPGQDMVYLEKEREAQRYMDAGAPEEFDPMEFPFLSGEIGVTAPSAYELAQVWLNMAAYWRAIAGALENARLTAVYAVETASTQAQIDAAVSVFEAALASL